MNVLFRQAAFACGICVFAAVAAEAGTFAAFGPVAYVRGSGEPQTIRVPVTVLNAQTQYFLHVQSDGVASAVISLNGLVMLSASRFNHNVTSLQVPIELRSANELSVELRGAPGGTITVAILGIDNDPPTISANISPPPNAAGWNDGNVTVTFACSDATSGIGACPSPIVVDTEGRGQVVSGTAVDGAGNSATAAVLLNIDTTPPEIRVTSPANNALLLPSNDAVLWTASDALSGITASTCGGAAAASSADGFACPWTLQPGENDLLITAADAAGNSTSFNVHVTLVTQTARLVRTLTATPAVVEAGFALSTAIRSSAEISVPADSSISAATSP